jgi:hypothetical protein
MNMPKTGGLTKGLAIAGTLLVWSPIVATLVTSILGSIRSMQFRLDWLMPAELSPLTAVGALLLLAAALLARARRGWVLTGIGISIGTIAAGSVIAQVSGLASGEVQPETAVVPWAMVLTAIGGYVAGVVVLGVAGILLLRDLFRRSVSRL